MSAEDGTVKAQARLSQVHSHISGANSEANISKTRRRKKERTGEDELPADYSDILGQIATLKKIAATPNTTARGYIRQKQGTKLTVTQFLHIQKHVTAELVHLYGNSLPSYPKSAIPMYGVSQLTL